MTEGEFEDAVREVRRLQKLLSGGQKTPEVVAEAERAERRVDDELRRREESWAAKPKTLFDSIDEWDEPPTERQLT